MQKVLIVGCGFMGRMHANVYAALEGVQLVGAVDKDADRRTAFGEQFGVPVFASFESGLGETDCSAVDICLPTFLHKEYTVAGAKAGKHVFCEKPMAMNLSEADEMIAACSSAGVGLMIGHCIRFWPEYALLKQIVVDGRLGKLVSLNLTRYGEFPHWSSDNWMADESKAGGGVLDMHIHDADYALYLLGEPKELVSFGSVDGRGPGHVFTTMQYPGCVVHLEGGWNLPNHTPFKMAFRAVFERGAAIMDASPMTIYEDGKAPVVVEFEKMSAEGGGNISDLGGYYHELKYFVDCLNSGTPFETVTPQTSRLSLATVLKEIEQIRARSC